MYFRHQASVLYFKVVLSLIQFLMDPGLPIMLGTYNVVIYCHSVVVLGELLESEFPKHTGNRSYMAWVPLPSPKFLVGNSQIHPFVFATAVLLPLLSAVKKCLHCAVSLQALS